MGNIINANLGSLSVPTVNPQQALLSGEQTRQAIEEGERQRRIESLRAALQQESLQAGFDPATSTTMQQLAAVSPEDAARSRQALGQLSQDRQRAFFQDAQKGLELVQNDKLNDLVSLIGDRRRQLQKLNADSSDLDFLDSMVRQGDFDAAESLLMKVVDTGIAEGFIKDVEGVKAEKDLSRREREARIRQLDRNAIENARGTEFERLISGLTPDQKILAILIKLGINPRAVGSAIQTITDKGIENEIGEASGKIKQREKFGELTGTSRAQRIDKGFDRIVQINKGINNLDRAINTVRGGAGVGAIERFLPSFKAASVELDQIQNELALDVIGGVTLGAISEAELELAKTVALPRGLDNAQLIQHLEERKAAQQKVRAYFNEQIQHLDQGGSVASFLRQKELEAGQAPGVETPQVAEPQAQLTQPVQVLRFDEQGNLIQ
jgi:hypothetical protein